MITPSTMLTLFRFEWGPRKMTTRLLQRQILPIDKDTDVFALYVDAEEARLDADRYEIGGNRAAKDLNNAAIRQSTSTGASIHPDHIESRTALRIPMGRKLSFGTYFNAFPASYWRRWTVVTDVTLTVRMTGSGASLTVYKSMANGRSQRVDAYTVGTDGSATFSVELSLTPFVDGGWYWYDVVAGDEDAVVESAEWTAEVPEDRAEHGTADIAITTMNRPDFCAKLIGQLAEDEALRPYLDQVLVMEQGSQPVTGSEFFPAAEKALGDQLRVIVQGNLGGSGGYARGQLESVRKGTATYALMMDDDVVCEPEGIIRAITFGDLAKRPTIVGGHMFSIYSRSRLHSFGEIVQMWRFWWMTPLDGFSDWDLSARNLRSARWLHKRVDVDFNGWFMCLIPRVVLEEIGLSLPLFIKWDDSEFGLRAKSAGFPTVTFPGAAVWHVPWTDKNDAVDWQAYFHHRNRFVAALLHSPYDNGGRMVRESLNHQIKHLVSLQYSTVEIRHQALLDVLAGPGQLHADLPTKLERDQRVPQAVQRRAAARGPGRLPAGAPQEAAAQGQGRHRDPGPALAADHRRARPDPAAAADPRAVPGVPRGRAHRDGREVVPPGALRLRDRLDERRQLGGALPAGPGPLPRPAQADPEDPRHVPAGVAAAGRGVPRGARRDHLARDVGAHLRAVRRGAGRG